MPKYLSQWQKGKRDAEQKSFTDCCQRDCFFWLTSRNIAGSQASVRFSAKSESKETIACTRNYKNAKGLGEANIYGFDYFHQMTNQT
jgi:hypothetical protein